MFILHLVNAVPKPTAYCLVYLFVLEKCPLIDRV